LSFQHDRPHNAITLDEFAAVYENRGGAPVFVFDDKLDLVRLLA
jgi:hypothetical protein